MRDRDDIAASERVREAVHGHTDAGTNLGKAFAASGTLVRGRVPVARRHGGPAGGELGAVETPPLAEMLFGELRDRTKRRRGFVLVEVSAPPEGLSGVVSAAEMGC